MCGILVKLLKGYPYFEEISNCHTKTFTMAKGITTYISKVNSFFGLMILRVIEPK